MPSYSSSTLLALGALLLAGCNTSAPTGVILSPWQGDISFDFADPVGDTLPAPNGEEGDVLDLVQIEGQVTETSITVQLTFSGPVTPFTSGQPNALSGFLDFDVDQNAATGVEAGVDVLGGNSGMGVDFFINLADNALGQMSIVSAGGSALALPFVITGSTVTFSFSRLLFGDEDGNMWISAVVSAGPRPATDIAPNEGHLTIQR